MSLNKLSIKKSFTAKAINHDRLSKSKTNNNLNKNNKLHFGHSARKRFGQNFLIDDYIISCIVNAINPQEDDFLLEIGPGLGAITEPIANLVSQLTVIELDRDLANRLTHHPFLHQKLKVIEADALTIDYQQLLSAGKKVKIFGNLPYNIATPLIIRLFDFVEQISEMHFMLQKEVVERMLASPGSKTYGRLSIICQYFCQLIPIIEVPPSSFKPSPKVDSAVIRLIPRTKYKVVTNPSKLSRVTAIAFGQRRKTIANCLKELQFGENSKHDDWQFAQSIGIDKQMRAEVISVEQFVLLTNYLSTRGLV